MKTSIKSIVNFAIFLSLAFHPLASAQTQLYLDAGQTHNGKITNGDKAPF
jgi:hypothetical protein